MFQQILVNTLYFVVLINPISKVSILSVLSSEDERMDFGQNLVKASLIAFFLLLGAMFFGEFTLRSIFRVELHSLRASGGFVLCWVGFNALSKGIFFEKSTQARFADIVLVPLACPMIAGPATIAACIMLPQSEGLLLASVSLAAAVGINHVFMVFSQQIGKALGRFNLLGALVRLTGLFVMTIGTQMIFDAITQYLSFPVAGVSP